MIEYKKVFLLISLVKTAAWSHKISANRLGFSPLQSFTGKTVSIPGLTIGNVSTESVLDLKQYESLWK